MPESILPSIEPLPLALPCPAWHTVDTQTGEGTHLFFRFLQRMSDRELLNRLQSQKQWFDFYFGNSGQRDGIVYSYPRSMTEGLYDAAAAVKHLIELEMVCRFEDAVKKRELAVEKASWTRKYKKARLA